MNKQDNKENPIEMVSKEKNKRLIGVLYINKNEFNFYINNDNQFENTTDDLNELAVCNNSPWSQTHETYTIKYNCKDSYTQKEEIELDWKCEYKVIGYDGITSIIYGYGNTPEESLKDCKLMCERLQKEYNKEDESF